MMNTWKIDTTMILTRTEIVRVLADLKRRARRSLNSRQNLAVFRLATCCGLRASEICGLKMADVRLGIDRPYLRIPKTIAKGKKARRVPLWWDRGTVDDLTAWRDERSKQGATASARFVCSQAKATAGNPLIRFAARRRFRTACRVLGPDRLEHLTVHHGRHSFVSHSLAGGRSLAAVRDAAGHANIATTSIYAHVVDDDDEPGDLFAFNGQ